MLALTYSAIPFAHTTACPSNRSSIPFYQCKRHAVPSTWRNCVFCVHPLGLGTTWRCYHYFFSLFMVCYTMLCHSITNAKVCNGEAVPSTWRNCFSFVDLLGLGTTWGCHSAFYGVLLRFAVHSTNFPPLLLQPPMPFLSSSHFHASACQYFAHQPILAGHACGRWAENGLCCFLLFLFCCYALPHLLFLYFASIILGKAVHESSSSWVTREIIRGKQVWVDPQVDSWTGLWIITALCLAFHSIFHFHASILLISWSFQGMFCGRWAKNGCFSLFLVC